MTKFKGAWVNEAGGTGPTCVSGGKLITFTDSSDVCVKFDTQNGRPALVPGRKYVIGAWDSGTRYDMTLARVVASPDCIVMAGDEANDLGSKWALFRR